MKHAASLGPFFEENHSSLNEEQNHIFMIQYAIIYLLERETYTGLTLREGVERHGLQNNLVLGKEG